MTGSLCIRGCVLLLAALSWCAQAQVPIAAPASTERRAGSDGRNGSQGGSGSQGWTPFGNTSILAGVAGAASGPVSRVWFREGAPAVQLPGGEVYRWNDRGEWIRWAEGQVPERANVTAAPEGRPRLRISMRHPQEPGVVYGMGDQIYRSEDGGRQWTGLTRYRGISILGEELSDLAWNPLDPSDLLVSSDLGVWRSRDGGLTWLHAGEGLPNFAARRILSFPAGTRGLQLQARDGRVLEWVPGSVYGWKMLAPEAAGARPPVPEAVRRLGERAVAWDASGAQIYAGGADGTILASPDRGNTWREYGQPGLRAILALYVDPADERVALAVAEDEDGERLLLRTLNSGSFWDNWTPLGLPEASWDAAVPLWEQGVLFVVAGESVFRIPADFRGMSRPTAGTAVRVGGLPARPVDLRLDPSGTVLFAIAQDRGVFSVDAPGVPATPQVRNAADLSRGATAPGTLLSVFGRPLRRLQANGQDAALLGGGAAASQVQLPYSISSSRVELAVESGASPPHTVTLPLRTTAPAIFLHPDGNPFVLHLENGLFMDENNPLVPGARFQVLLTGLGAVTPDWPAGMAAPLENPPSVLARTEAFVNGLRVPVIRATLAPGYAGIYLVEVELPGVIDEGVAEFRILADGILSNPAPLHIAY